LRAKGADWRNYNRSSMQHGLAADPDGRRTRGLHSLAESVFRQALLELFEHSPRRSNLCSSTLAVTRRCDLFRFSPAGLLLAFGFFFSASLGPPSRWREGRGDGRFVFLASSPCPLRRHLEVLGLGQDRPGHARVLRRYRHHRLPVSPPLGHLHGPAAQRVALARRRIEHRPGADDQ